MKQTHDPATYRRLSEPFKSRDEALVALEAFHAEVRALREKHHIRDVSMVWGFSCMTPEGEIEMAGQAHIGDVNREVGMLAWALGRAEEAFGALLASARKGRTK